MILGYLAFVAAVFIFGIILGGFIERGESK